jgi:aspartate/methionine/tyrosine aminotransferase
MEAVQTPIIPVIGELADKTPGTIPLGQGVVVYPPPPEAFAALQAFFADPGNHQYGPVEGDPELIEALEAKLLRDNGIRVRPDSRVVITAGANMAFVHALLAITDPGDEIILLSPYYFNHEMAVEMIGCRAVAVPTSSSHQPDLEAIRGAITARSRAIVTISPNNPTGAVYSADALRAINELCAQRGLYHMSDEIYEYFTYRAARHYSPGSATGAGSHTISMYSFSKSYGMASWRVGYMVVPSRLSPALVKVQDTIIVCAPGPAQAAALGAVRGGAQYCRVRAGEFDLVRHRALARLAEIADIADVVPPDGAFYLFVRVRTPLSAQAVAERLIREHRVATLPASAFGFTEGCALRIGYGALDEHTVEQGMTRLVDGLRAIVKGP